MVACGPKFADEYLHVTCCSGDETVLADSAGPSTLDFDIRKAGGRMTGKSRRGFASMDPARQKEIASRGGRAAHEKGTAHEWSSGEARDAGRKGGVTVSRDRAHMAAIGREGGESRSAAARLARQNGSSEREVPMSISRDGMDSRRPESRPADRIRSDIVRADGHADSSASAH